MGKYLEMQLFQFKTSFFQEKALKQAKYKGKVQIGCLDDEKTLTNSLCTRIMCSFAGQKPAAKRRIP